MTLTPNSTICEIVGRDDLEGQRAGAAPIELEERAVLGNEVVGAGGERGFEEFLVVGVAAARQSGPVFLRKGVFEEVGEAPALGEAGVALVHIQAVFPERVGQHALELGLARRVDEDLGLVQRLGAADRADAGIVEHQPVDPDLGVEHEAQWHADKRISKSMRREISREEVNELPIRRYEGPVHVVAAPQDLERARTEILEEGVVGFDTETRPAFHVGQSYPPSLVQVATARAVYLFQVQRTDCSAAIAGLLSSEKIVKAGVALADDLRKLKLVFPFEDAAIVDLGRVAQRHGLKQPGVRNLAALFLGLRIPKGTKTSNWSAPHLSPQQIAYAATDAWACRELYLRFGSLGLLTPAAPAPPLRPSR